MIYMCQIWKFREAITASWQPYTHVCSRLRGEIRATSNGSLTYRKLTVPEQG